MANNVQRHFQTHWELIRERGLAIFNYNSGKRLRLELQDTQESVRRIIKDGSQLLNISNSERQA